jgi:hypothetical protein
MSLPMSLPVDQLLSSLVAINQELKILATMILCTASKSHTCSQQKINKKLLSKLKYLSQLFSIEIRGHWAEHKNIMWGSLSFGV